MLLARLLLAILAATQVTSVEIPWRDYNDAMREAAEKQRPIFLYFGASWNGPAKKFEAEVLRSPETARLLKEKFVNVRIDINQENTRDLVTVLGIERVPTVIIASHDKNILYFVSPRTSQELNERLRQALTEATAKRYRRDGAS
ncbi:MAG: thioredoxin family protein [Planctomycetes bacterium]|nr:thioredoxin family protein [Planctomycetota bacterium]